MKSLAKFADSNGVVLDAPVFSDTVASVVLTTASTAVGTAVPTGANVATITVDSASYLNLRAVAAVPAATAAIGSSIYMPAGSSRTFYIDSGMTSISLISATASAKATIEFYSR